MTYFYASSYRNTKIDSIAPVGDGKQIRKFLQDLSYINTRKEELILLKAHRGTKSSPNSFNRQLDLKYFGIPFDAEPDPAFYGFDINEHYSSKENEKEELQKYLDSEDGYGNKQVVGDYQYVSDSERERIVNQYLDDGTDENSGVKIKSKEELKEERNNRIKEIRQDGKMHLGAIAAEQAKYMGKSGASNFLQKHQNGLIMKMVRFFSKFGLIILKVGLVILILFLLLNLGLYIGGSFSSVGETPFAICRSGNSDNHQPIAYRLSLNNDFKEALKGNIWQRFGSGAEFIDENILKSKDTGIIENGRTKKHKEGDKDYKFSLPVDQTGQKGHHTANLDTLYKSDPKINMSKLCTGYKDENKCIETLKNMYTGKDEAWSLIGGDTEQREFIITRFLDHVDYVTQSGVFNSFESSEYSIQMRWEYMDYDIGEDGNISNQKPNNSDDIKVYKEWLKRQKIVVFNPSQKKYVVLKIDTSGSEETNDLTINWGPNNISHLGSISSAAATYLGFGGDENGNSKSDNMYLGVYWVPEDTRIGPVDIPNKEYNACRTNGGSAGLVSEGEYVTWKQCGKEWSGEPLGNSSNHTICSAGCAMTSVSIMLAKSQVQLTIPEQLTPGTFNSSHRSNGGFDGAAIIWDVGKETNNQITSTKQNEEYMCGLSDSAKIDKFSEFLTNGYLPVIQVKGCGADGTHYVFVDAIVDGQIMIIDPGGGPEEVFPLTDRYPLSHVGQTILYKVVGQ